MAPFPPALKAAARSAYRAMMRASRVTFQGDPARHLQMVTAVRQTFSSPSLTPPPPGSASTVTRDAPSEPLVEEIEESEIAKRIEEWQEAARYLRKNIVQGVLDERGNWKLRVTDQTELGDNASIKNPPKLPTTPFPNRNRRKCGDAKPAPAAKA
ncbi:hypothetical protein I316_07742 [Kwoniella heveanensis BCC8398]|uniref:Mitochondrial zinc maintenance protein 1, mitochondrial n=1 Tax=Kwoniella heveanensis BCC8398 TaxID=1296120 RepID=A0A1B9GHR4_9TREE|nr:hypothetical protein I316_07742 [Kwoniella heveanensis BCC8398]